jgi:hypothetical protein
LLHHNVSPFRSRTRNVSSPFVHQAGDGHGGGCAVFNRTCPSQVLLHALRSVLHVSPGPDAAHGGTSLSGERCSSPLHGLDSHDGPVVLTCQGFAGLPTPCVRLFSRELHRRQRWRRIRKPSQTRCSRWTPVAPPSSISVSTEADAGGAGGCGLGQLLRASEALHPESYSQIGSKEAVIGRRCSSAPWMSHAASLLSRSRSNTAQGGAHTACSCLARSVAADRVHRGHVPAITRASVRRSAGWCERRRVTRRVGCLSSGLSHTLSQCDDRASPFRCPVLILCSFHVSVFTKMPCFFHVRNSGKPNKLTSRTHRTPARTIAQRRKLCEYAHIHDQNMVAYICTID